MVLVKKPCTGSGYGQKHHNKVSNLAENRVPDPNILGYLMTQPELFEYPNSRVLDIQVLGISGWGHESLFLSFSFSSTHIFGFENSELLSHMPQRLNAITLCFQNLINGNPDELTSVTFSEITY